MPQEKMVSAEAERREDWLAVLDAHRVEYVLLDSEEDGYLLREVETHPSWTIELRDGASVFLRRTQSSAKAPRVG